MAASVKLQPLITIIGRLILLARNKVICEQALKIPAPKPINNKTPAMAAEGTNPPIAKDAKPIII